MRIWRLQEAKKKFDEVYENAIRQGLQLITKCGVQSFILLSYKPDHQQEVNQQKISTFFQQSPLAETPLDLKRDKSKAQQRPGV